MYRENQHIDLTDFESEQPFDKKDIHDGERVKRDFREETGKTGGHKEEQTGTKTLPDEEDNQNKKVRFKELIDGTFFFFFNVLKQLPFILFLTFLGVLYIGNRFHAEYMVRQINDLKIEVGNLRSEQITTTSELMNISRPSEVAALVESKGLGLKESMEPPKKLKR
jgi:hypothetical protein